MTHAAAISYRRPNRILGNAQFPKIAKTVVARQCRSFTHWAALALVWLTLAASGIVFSEPAPVDALSIILVGLLPLVGLTRITPMLLLYLSLWLIVGAGHFVSTHFAMDENVSLRFSAVSLYLYLASFTFAAFVAQRPKEHLTLVLNGWVFAAVVAAAAGFVGYFSLIPGAFEIFTKYGRLAGTFKDPNVFGPFVVAPILYLFHLALNRGVGKAVIALGVCSVLALALLLSFSRGAWLNLAISVVVFVYLSFLTIRTFQQRRRLLSILLLGLVACTCVLAVAVQFDAVAKLLAERASLEQSYDLGPEGRFGGQTAAGAIIAENPLGIGAMTFGSRHHGEDVHNVYLSIFLNAGWVGGSIYCVLVLLTLGLGFRHLLTANGSRPLFLVIYAAFVGTAIEGLIVDTDHWRSFYILMGLCWGLMTSPHIETVKDSVQQFARRARIVGVG